MTYSQPRGFRLPANTSLTSISRALERFGWPLWRVEVVRAVANISVDLLASPEDRDAVYHKWSHGQISESDMVLSHTNQRGLLYRAAEFLDVGHNLMHKMTALPLPIKIDLRCRAQFMDDRYDPERRWTYVLFGTEHVRLEDAFANLRGMEDYPLAFSSDIMVGHEPDACWSERAVTWDRVLEPYNRSSPLAISAPEPQISLDIAESLYFGNRDEEYTLEGKTTVTSVVAEVARMLGTEDVEDLKERLIAPIKS
ncbi:MAG: hypothetical protein ACTHWA_12400 [Arachnia sp.]